MKEIKTLTTGSVSRNLFFFALPLLLANLLQSFYSVVDMVVVGNLVGETGLAAISNASSISFIINSICIGVTMGGTVLTARYQGANDRQARGETVRTLFKISLWASFAVTAAALAVYRPVLQAMNVPAEAMEDACGYMRVISLGTVFVFGYNAACSVLKGLGDSRSPLGFVAAAAAVNIVLDLALVGPFHMGTVGAAYATVFSQAVSCFLALLHLKRKTAVFDVSIQGRREGSGCLKELLRIGLPTAIQMVVVNLSYLLVTGMLNQFGVAVAAASGIGLKINTFAGMPCWAVGQAVTAMAGQNMGAGDLPRVRRTVKTGLRLNLLVTLASVLTVQLFAGPLVALFEPENREVIQDGILYLRICCGINSLVYAAMYTFDSFAIGAGSAGIAMGNALLDAVFVRIPVSWILAFCLDLGAPGVYIGQAVSPILPAAAGFWYWKRGAWASRRPEMKGAEKEGRF